MDCCTLDEFLRTYGPLDKARFIATFPHAFLLVDLSAPSAKPGDHATRGPAPARETREIEVALAHASARWVMPVLKSARDLDPERITLGRATNNDLVIPHGSVSKLHAFFKKHAAADRYTIFDAGSSFGTTVNGEGLDKAAGRTLASGDAIVFAKAVTSKFYHPKELFDYLHLLWRERKSRIL